MSATYIEHVQQTIPVPGEAIQLDRERGRTHAREKLRLYLAHAPVAYLDGALDNPNLGPDEVVTLLRNGASTAEIAERVAGNKTWMRVRSVTLALVGNPRTPQVIARRYLPHLTWRDLAEISTNPRVSPFVRREGERLLRTRIPELAAGEKLVLARRAGRGLLELLLSDGDDSVLRALAGNPRVTEHDLGVVLAREDLPSAFLSWLGEQSSWGQRREIRLALVRHPRTPSASSLRLMRGLSPRDLDQLRNDPSTPRLARVAAERFFGGRSPTAAGGGSRLG